MYIFYSSKSLQDFLQTQLQTKKIGFVPTMGALHEGHLSIIKKSQKEHDVTLVSIYVNPAQFNRKEDFDKYPNTLHHDIEKLFEIKVDILFLPSEIDIYPHGIAVVDSENVGFLDTVLEGKFRPGHFKGVKAVIRSFLNIVQPHSIYLGQKDYQQFLVVQQLIEEEKISVQLKMFSTVREVDGLAMSSRNFRLSEQERKTAAHFFQIMQQSAVLAKEKNIEQAKKWAEAHFLQLPDVQLEYLEFADMKSMQILKEIPSNQKAILCLAAWVGNVRLIDNLIL